MMKKTIYVIVLLFCMTISASAQTVQPELVTLAENLDMMTDMVTDQDGRIYAVQKKGLINIIPPNDFLMPEPFFNYVESAGGLVYTSSESGLLGMAFHPNFAENRYVFFYYNTKIADDQLITRISRFEQMVDNRNKIDLTTETIFLELPQEYEEHNGGELLFGVDGQLYISLGDGGENGDPYDNGQNINNLYGAILRINVDGEGIESNCAEGIYRIPEDNPFVGTDGCDEIWAYGLRNPWKMSFDEPTGNLWVADVGQADIEEINLIRPQDKGLNFGWDCLEGDITHINRDPSCDEGVVTTYPVSSYTHNEGGCAIIGGHVYRGETYPQFQGSYFYADYCTSLLWRVYFDEDLGRYITEKLGRITAPDGGFLTAITTFGIAYDGEMLVNGKEKDRSWAVYRLQFIEEIEDTTIQTLGGVEPVANEEVYNPPSSEPMVDITDRSIALYLLFPVIGMIVSGYVLSRKPS